VKIRYISSPRNGNIYDMAAPRLAQGHPLQNDAALLILQSGTGKVQSFILFYTCSLPPHEVVSVSQSTAVSAANKVIASDKLQGFKIGTPQQHWVQFRQPGTYSGTPPFRLAWDIPYSDGHRTANVMIDSATGLTLINSVGPTRFPPP